MAAPLLARQAAFALHHLQSVCEPGARAFVATAKAFLALTATPFDVPARCQPLAERTLGRGRANAERLWEPVPNSAVMMWQGVLEAPGDVAHIQLPIPLDWLQSAKQPRLRLVCAWESPVHMAVQENWACRKVTAHLKPGLATDALRSTSRNAHRSYPLIDRTYDLTLSRLTGKIFPEGDLWLLELSYEQISEYAPGIDFTPLQRVAFAAELTDLERVLKPRCKGLGLQWLWTNRLTSRPLVYQLRFS